MTSEGGQAFRPKAPGEVRLRGVDRRFGARWVLRKVTVDLEAGTVVALVGPNGSGKTTLLRILSGLVAPTAGAAAVCGSSPGRGAALYVPPGDRGLYWRLTGRQNLEFFGRIAGLRRVAAAAWAEVAADRLAASPFLPRAVGACSTGERRRLSLARGFVAGPPVVLLDEPFADLDEAGRVAAGDATRSWAEGGGVVVCAGPRHEDVPDPDLLLLIDEGSVGVERR